MTRHPRGRRVESKKRLLLTLGKLGVGSSVDSVRDSRATASAIWNEGLVLHAAANTTASGYAFSGVGWNMRCEGGKGEFEIGGSGNGPCDASVTAVTCASDDSTLSDFQLQGGVVYLSEDTCYRTVEASWDSRHLVLNRRRYCILNTGINLKVGAVWTEDRATI